MRIHRARGRAVGRARRCRVGCRRERADGRREGRPPRPGRREAAGRRAGGRAAVHQLHLPGDAQEARALSRCAARRATLVTRGFPSSRGPGERVDHPHQVGLWFNYGDVNGIDFWNNSDAIKPEDRPEDGHHRAQGRDRATQRRGQGRARDRHGLGPARRHGRAARAHAVRVPRRGRLAERGPRSRACRRSPSGCRSPTTRRACSACGWPGALEMPSTKPDVFTDASGRATTVKVLDNTGVSGDYLTSEGKKGDAVWGTRARWCTLSGRVGEEPVTVAILDHPSNPGLPDLLARARVRPVRREPARSEGAQRRQGNAGLRDRAAPGRDVPPSRADPVGDGRGRPRRGGLQGVRRGVPLTHSRRRGGP